MFGRHFCRAACCRAQCSHIAIPASPRKNVIFLLSSTAFHLFSIPYVVVSLAPLQPQNINFRGLSVRSKVGIPTGRGLLCQARGQHSSICNPRSSPPPQFRSFSFFFHSFSAYCLNLYLTFQCRCGKLFHRATRCVLKAQPQRP